MHTSTPRTGTATGFALLQLQRGQVVVAVEELSTAADWQIKAYQCLKLLLPMYNNAVTPETLDFAVFHYYTDKVVSNDCCIALPQVHTWPCIAMHTASKLAVPQQGLQRRYACSIIQPQVAVCLQQHKATASGGMLAALPNLFAKHPQGL
jgi:hypothetical protein